MSIVQEGIQNTAEGSQGSAQEFFHGTTERSGTYKECKWGSWNEKTRKMKAYCNQHKEKVLELFCLDCKIPICALCSVKLHKPHECVDVTDVVDEFRKQMADDIKRMFGSLAQC